MQFRPADQPTDIQQILDLQSKNLKKNISEVEKRDFGFLTVQHTYEVLHKMNDYCRSIVADENGVIAGYCISMPYEFKAEVPELVAMFDLLDGIKMGEHFLKDLNYYVMGQICVAKECRGQGVFQGLYMAQKEHLKTQFDWCITEVSVYNTRSMRAHANLGFQEIHRYFDPSNDDTWAVVAWKIS